MKQKRKVSRSNKTLQAILCAWGAILTHPLRIPTEEEWLREKQQNRISKRRKVRATGSKDSKAKETLR